MKKKDKKLSKHRKYIKFRKKRKRKEEGMFSRVIQKTNSFFEFLKNIIWIIVFIGILYGYDFSSYKEVI